MFILAQIIGGIVLILTVVSVQFKTKEKILMCQIIAKLLEYVLQLQQEIGLYIIS